MGGHHHHDHHHLQHAVNGPASEGDARYREMRNVTLVGSALDLTLGVLKMVFGYLANSQALIADGIHSLSDLATDFMVLFAAKHGSRDADESHPYGHGRFETLATVALGIALIIIAVGIAWDAIGRLFNPEA
ncbi:MAG TPA: cation diffusion facilitator family transporter, partial [Gammaproteobacteria bacterium]